jgi:tetratricopeptide (TPR) repeat protein
MSETLDYIDDYFAGALSAPEKLVFEQRCVSDHGFAQEVAFYLSARGALKAELHAQKRELFGNRKPAAPATSRGKVKRLLPYLSAAAACVLLLLGWLLFFKPSSPSQLADEYITQHLKQLSLTMHSDADSLQKGIAAYNQADYQSAENIFQSLTRQEAIAPDAVRYLGLVYLMTGKYDKAIVQFDTLTRYPLYANPGPFYKALALMKRASPGDISEAKTLLEDVRSRELPGSKQAVQWLKNL